MRVNHLCEAFRRLVGMMLTEDFAPFGASKIFALVDSMPIITCSGKRRGKVAPEMIVDTESMTTEPVEIFDRLKYRACKDCLQAQFYHVDSIRGIDNGAVISEGKTPDHFPDVRKMIPMPNRLQFEPVIHRLSG
jgi:hypothetical protein